MTTPILKITEAANGQVDQYLTYNEALRALEASANNFYVVDMSSGDVTLTDTANTNPALNYIFSRNQVFRTTGNTVARVLTVPQSKRLFVVQNGGSAAVTVKRGTSEVSLAATLSSIFYCDGTANGLVEIVNTGNYVAGPASSANNEIALFDGASGKSLKRGPVVGTAASANLVTSSTDTTAGGATTVGWLGNGRALAYKSQATDDLNDFNVAGAHGLWGGDSLNRPTNDVYIVHVLGGFTGPSDGQIPNRLVQVAYRIGGAEESYRRSYVFSWSAWQKEWNTGNTSAAVQTLLGSTDNAAIRSAISASSLPPYTLATVPSAAANTNLLIMITDLTGGREPCFSDGTDWLRCSDKTIAD